MRIAVFSDIHGNGLALEAVLADIQAKAPDRLVCLGAFNKARIPPVPQGIEGDGETLTLNFTCSP